MRIGIGTLGRACAAAACIVTAIVGAPASAQPLDESVRERADRIAERAIDYLRTQQDEATGG